METLAPIEKTPEQPALAPSKDPRIALIGLTREELHEALVAEGAEAYRAQQVWSWIYKHGATSFDAMLNIGAPGRQLLNERFVINRPAVARELKSLDDTRKWLISYEDGNKVETVFIPEDDRGALCVSSQVGCTLACTFCHTGTMKLVRNLTAAEIVAQMLVAKDGLNEWPAAREARKLTNIVMMGMGEPLFNYDHVSKALKIIMDGDGLGLSKRRITLSTSGVVPMIDRCGAELEVNLAVSLHAVNDELRNQIVPLNRKYPIRELLDACRRYPAARNSRRITFEYVMLKGVNDSDADARELVRLLKDIPAKVNLIPFNPWPGAPYECASNNRMHAFAQIVNNAGYSSPIRTPRGRDIFAACGQLKSDSERKKGEKVKLH